MSSFDMAMVVIPLLKVQKKQFVFSFKKYSLFVNRLMGDLKICLK